MCLIYAENKKIFEGMPEPTSQEPEFSWIKDGKPFDPEERFKVLFQVYIL